MERTKFEHPSIGLVGLSRWSGSMGKMVGSDIEHHGGIALTISHAHSERRLSQTHFYPEDEIVKVYLTESQFAQLITRFNQEGTPCTVRNTEKDGPIEMHKPVTNELELHKLESIEVINELQDKIQGLIDQVKEMVDSKKAGTKAVAKVLQNLGVLQSHFSSNQNFMVESLKESMVDTVTEAKIDFEAYVQNHPMLSGEPVKDIKLLD